MTVMAKVLGAELPQVLLAVTDTVPVEPDVVIILVVADVPVHPFGRDHV